MPESACQVKLCYPPPEQLDLIENREIGVDRSSVYLLLVFSVGQGGDPPIPPQCTDIHDLERERSRHGIER